MIARWWLCLLLFLSATIVCAEDSIDDENESGPDDAKSKAAPEKEAHDNSDFPSALGPSPDVQTAFLFTSESIANRELVAGKVVKFLIGFANHGEKDFLIKNCDTSFRYPLDFSYRIQNFSLVTYNRLVSPKQEASFDYAFIPSDVFIGRPLGLVIDLYYEDSDGSAFVHTVFNETVAIVEDESSFQTETYFLYVILGGFVVLIIFMIKHFLSKFTRKSPQIHQPTYELGTNKNEVDFQWIPRMHLESNKSPKMGSPRNRKPLKSVG